MSFDRATRRGFTAATVLLVALVGRSAAGAGAPGDRAAARQHLSQAEELKKHGQLAEACKQVEESERLDPQLPTLMELAECNERLGKLVEAQGLWAQARDRAKHDEKPQSRARAEARLLATEKRVAHLTLQLPSNAPAGVQVLRDDVVLEPASLAGALPIDPGDHAIVVKLAGHDDAKYAVKLADGDNQTLAIAPGPESGARRAPPPPPAAPPAAPPSASLAPLPSPNVAVEPTQQAAQPPAGWWTGPRTAGVILGSAGIVGIGAGTALCVIGKRDADRRGSTFDDRLALGGISLAGGGVLLLTGAVLLFSAPTDESHQHARSTVSPTLLVARSEAVLGAAGEF